MVGLQPSVCLNVRRLCGALGGRMVHFLPSSSGWFGRVWSAKEKSFEILCHSWELNSGHGEGRQWDIFILLPSCHDSLMVMFINKGVISRSRVDALAELCSPKGGNSAFIAAIASGPFPQNEYRSLHLSWVLGPFVYGRLQNMKTSEDIVGHDVTPLNNDLHLWWQRLDAISWLRVLG